VFHHDYLPQSEEKNLNSIASQSSIKEASKGGKFPLGGIISAFSENPSFHTELQKVRG
jgi:hypothetical protein